jgi:hypothetical protein
MESDSRLMMMAMREKTNRPARVQPRKPIIRRYSATAATSIAAFALTLFTRGT